jgi:hypothetical protein
MRFVTRHTTAMPMREKLINGLLLPKLLRRSLSTSGNNRYPNSPTCTYCTDKEKSYMRMYLYSAQKDGHGLKLEVWWNRGTKAGSRS